MSPLIDCIFQLLIFFMLSSTFLTPSIRLTLPQAGGAARPESDPIMVTLDAKSNVFVNKEPTSLDQLSSALKPLIDASEKKVVTIRGDEKMPYELFVRALDAGKGSGARTTATRRRQRRCFWRHPRFHKHRFPDRSSRIRRTRF